MSDRDPARLSVRLRSEGLGLLTIRIGNASSSGGLTVRNSSWTCVQASSWAVTCTGGRGQALLEQSGSARGEAIAVRVTDASGGTWTQTLHPS